MISKPSLMINRNVNCNVLTCYMKNARMTEKVPLKYSKLYSTSVGRLFINRKKEMCR